MNKKHSVIFIPGLGNDIGKLEWATRHWRRYGLEPRMHSVGWRDSKKEFQPKLERLVNYIDQLAEKGYKVSLVGTSAGGSAALNAFIKRRDIIHRIVNVCGRLRIGSVRGFRSFTSRTASSPAFAQSVKLAEANESSLHDTDRRKIMTVRAMFGDELVPAETIIVKGAYNTLVPTAEHMVSIAAALTVFSRSLVEFLIKD